MSLHLPDAQMRVETAICPTGGYWPKETICLRLAEEVGEVCRALRKESPARLESEIGDVLFTVICLANALGADLDYLLSIKCERARDGMIESGVNFRTGYLETGE